MLAQSDKKFAMLMLSSRRDEADKAKEAELRFKALGAVWDGLKNTIGFHLLCIKVYNVILRGVVAVRLFLNSILRMRVWRNINEFGCVGAAMTAIGAILH